MPAESEKQRRFFALVNSIQTGKRSSSGVGNSVKQAVKSTTSSQSRGFMSLKKK